MKKILMYSGPMCNFCEAAKRLLDRNNLKYSVIDVSSGANIREEMTNKSLCLSLSDLGSSVFISDWASSKHQKKYTRLFRS